MTTDELKQLMTAYQSAYGPGVTPANREYLLRQSVSDEVVFFTPTAEGRGIKSLIEHVAQFQQKNPGGYFASGDLVAHHGRLLAEWTLYDKDSTAVSGGHTYARFSDNGRLTQLIGFFKT